MPELVDLAAIGLWSTAACVQLGMAIFDRWKSRNLTAYQRVVKGEKINGWRMLVPAENLPKRCCNHHYWFVWPSWSMLDEDGTDLGKLNKFSMLVVSAHTSPDNRKVFFIRRYSLINPKVHAPIIQLVYDPDQWYDMPECFYLTDRTIVLTMEQVDTLFIRLILVDVITRSYRMFMLEAPEDDTILLMVTTGDTTKPRLIVHLMRMTKYILWQREFIDADGAVFCATNFGGIQVRSIDPPSLLWLAAAAFCKANPEYKLEDLLEVIGFDMFDGIFGYSEADAPLIYL